MVANLKPGNHLLRPAFFVKRPMLANSKQASLLLFFLFLMLGSLPNSTKAEKLNINTATEAELTSLPYIGPVRAKTIITCRSAYGQFREIKELLTCDGIGPDTIKIMQADLAIPSPPEQSSPASQQDKKEGTPGKIETSKRNLSVLKNEDYFPALLSKIRGAEKSIDLAMFVFKTTDSAKNRPSMVVSELQAAADRGIKIRVFLEKSGYDNKLNATNQQTAEQLRKHGIEITFDSAKTTTHTKLIIIDRRYSLVGSHNFTHAALKYNNELSLLIDDQELADRLTNYMESIIDR